MKILKIVLISLITIAVIVGGIVAINQRPDKDNNSTFNSDRAFIDLKYQVEKGPRIPGSSDHLLVGDWLQDELKSYGWEIELHETVSRGVPLRNIIGKYGEGERIIILGAHYDTRVVADQESDPFLQSQPVPGANDGASGVAVLLEIARIIPDMIDNNNIIENPFWRDQIWIVFFDGEDNGDLPGLDWALGSQAFVQDLDELPEAVVIVDMVGDEDLNICYETNSDENLLLEIWGRAEEIGYEEYFDRNNRCSIRDDHTAFIRAGIPAVDIIDFDYPYWHTTQDTIDKVSPESLKVIGDTIISWLGSK